MSDIKVIIAVCKTTGDRFNDYKNISGVLTKHIKTIHPGIELPSRYIRLSQSNKGLNWLEEFFIFIEEDEEIKPKHKCKLCDWETIDVDNKSGYLKQHLYKEHNLTSEEYIVKFPEEETYFKKDYRIKQFESDPDKWVECYVCGGKFSRLSNHLKHKHNLTKKEYCEIYGLSIKETISKDFRLKSIASAVKANLAQSENKTKEKFISKGENIIFEYLSNLGVDLVRSNRSILGSKELDIVSHDKKIAIEYNGLKWHTEWFGGKDKHYHLNKTIDCNNNGYKLIQIFEDELVYNKDLVLGKLKHIFGFSDGRKIGARKTIIKRISFKESFDFHNKFHIQGGSKATYHLGAFYGDILVGVMSFKELVKGSSEYDLVRYSTNSNFIISGLGNKLLNYFINNIDVISIISFADRRWTLDKYNNLYTKMGFKLVSELNPDYKYYSNKVSRYERFHKFGFRKHRLHTKYGLDITMTEIEMVKALGYDRIWDCGLFKYKLEIKKGA